MTRPRLLLATMSLLTLLITGCAVGGGDEDAVRVYSGRHYDLEVAFERFAEETGINVEFLFGSDAELRERIQAEGEDTEADVYLTVDAGNLSLAAEEGLFQPLDSAVLDEVVPENIRHPDGLWYGLSQRVRTFVYDPDDVDPSELGTYADLADPAWDGRLCMRNASNVYQQSLVASLIANHGYERALEIVEGWVANDVQILGSDILVLETIAQGGCDVGLTNHYYLARLLEDDPDFGVDLAFAGQDAEGVHVNVSGAGVTRFADNPDLAQQLLEWLADDGQDLFANSNHEYPVNDAVEPDELVVEEFGSDFSADPLNAAEYGSFNADAVRLMAEAGFE
ncbi:extracellular solute-binding protein [Euzebya tangerina]|uniref:extracellular solute-binding protein n=1 Tax=Euzebya tangerina TaxID=591198 RepID=UPI000E31326C|nr:extracellular solute-binding protein [Euzebya tangerina]